MDSKLENVLDTVSVIRKNKNKERKQKYMENSLIREFMLFVIERINNETLTNEIFFTTIESLVKRIILVGNNNSFWKLSILNCCDVNLCMI